MFVKALAPTEVALVTNLMELVKSLTLLAAILTLLATSVVAFEQSTERSGSRRKAGVRSPRTGSRSGFGHSAQLVPSEPYEQRKSTRLT